MYKRAVGTPQVWTHKPTNPGDSVQLCHIDWQPVGNREVGNSAASAPLPRHGKYPPATNVCQIYQPWERGQKDTSKINITFRNFSNAPKNWVPTSKQKTWGRDSSVGIATRYGLDGRKIESRWLRDFPHPSRPALGPPNLLYNGYRVFPGGTAAGAWRWQSDSI